MVIDACELKNDNYMQHIDVLMTQLKVFATRCSSWVVDTLKQPEIITVFASKGQWGF